MKDLALDIIQYVENADPFEFRDIYETTEDAVRDTLQQLKTDPESLIDYFAGILVDLEYGIETAVNTEINAELNAEYAKVFDIIERIKKEGGHAA